MFVKFTENQDFSISYYSKLNTDIWIIFFCENDVFERDLLEHKNFNSNRPVFSKCRISDNLLKAKYLHFHILSREIFLWNVEIYMIF